ncbi:uncharacterized protein BKA55DRAFT_727489 [Fusarium redolens]|uniref:Uncharacterized protein n=1 Tax=Fusarium redolens TaxID=48865 RepID=A0A9P9KIX1_FUSRE|nr:uncharacterized protein BKA55DRAFT_727489 [Fusarium redolens]KAH7254264.1 hypothetical protein BKA55DRAFT_727489 [Fusarium redolens]
MSKQTTIGGRPGGWSIFGPALKNKVDKVKEIMGKLGDSLDKVRRGPVSSATEAGFTPENVEKAKGWRTEVDTLEAQLHAQVRDNARVDETVRDVRDQLRRYDSTLAAARELGDENDETSQELAAEVLGWLIQEHPRVRLFAEAMGHEMTPEIEQAIARLNPGDPNDSLTARMSQVATQGPSRDELIGQIDQLESKLRSAQEQANAKGVVIASMAEIERQLQEDLEKEKRKEVAIRKKTEEEVEKALDLKREAESSEGRLRAELCQAKRDNEVMESELKDKDDKLRRQAVQIRELENGQRTELELKAVNDKHMKDLEAQVTQLRTTVKERESSRDALDLEVNTLRKDIDAKDANIRDLNAQVAGGMEKLVQQEDLVKGRQLLIEERDRARVDLEYHRQLGDSRLTASEDWRKRCEKRDSSIHKLDNEVADLRWKLKETKTEVTKLTKESDSLSAELREAEDTIREQGESIDSLQRSANGYFNEVKDIAKLNDGLGQEVKNLNLQLSKMKLDMSSKGDSIRERDGLIKQLAQQKTQLKRQCRDAEAEVKDLTEPNEELKGRVDSLTKQVTSYRSKGSKYKSALDKTKQDHKSALTGANQAACTMANLVMTQCPPGLQWSSIVESIDWNSQMTVALPTQSSWKIQESWSKDPRLAVSERTDCLTTLLLLIVASVESGSLVDMVSCLAAIQMRLDVESECIFPVLKLFLDAVSVCIGLEGVHAFQVFLLLQVAERIGRAWPEFQDTVNELTHRGGSHELTSSVSRSVALWGQGQRQDFLDCETSLQYQDWALVGFFRNPNGILLLGGSELRWADHDFVKVDGNDISVGEGDDEIEFEVEGQNWNWWVEHIL